MRKLTPIEESAYAVLQREGSILIGDDELTPVSRKLVKYALDGLVKKKRAVVEMTDAGPRYHAA
jgi:hypothetical protein